MNKVDLSIIVPIFNEEESINILFLEIKENIDENYNWELIFINDGSTDSSREVILKLCRSNPNILFFDSNINKGKSEALHKGFQECLGDIVITLDADLQDDPKEIINFIKKIKEGNDLVSGWKKNRKDPISKTIPSKIYNSVLRFLFKIKLNDYNCGFKAYKKDVVKTLNLYGGLHRFIPVLAKQNGFIISEIVVNHRERKYGQSKYGTSRMLHGFFDLITTLFLNKYLSKPLHFFGLIGFFLSFVGFSINLYLSFYWLYNNYFIAATQNFTINRPLLFLGILLLIIGIQLISIGLIGELLVRFFKKNRADQYTNNKIEE